MSNQARTWAQDQQEIAGDKARHVLLALASYARADGTGAFPSIARLQLDTDLSERCIRYQLRKLQAAGLIRRGDQGRAAYLRADRRPTVYDLALERGARRAPRGGGTGGTVVQLRGAHGAPDPSQIIIPADQPPASGRRLTAIEERQREVERDMPMLLAQLRRKKADEG